MISKRRRVPARTSGPWLLVLLLATIVALSGGCATRTVRESFVGRKNIDVDFVSEKMLFGGTIERGYEHPAIVSVERMSNVLGSIEVETRQPTGGLLRQPAIHPEILEKTAEALASAFAKVGEDQEIAVKVVRKQSRLGLLHQKFLTSFLAHMEDGHLYVLLSRVEWQIPKAKEGDKLPEPRRDYAPMTFRVVSGDHVYYAGPRSLEIDWQNPIFRTAYRLPGSSGGEKRTREVLMDSPIPKAELDEAAGSGVSIDQLSPEQMRALADLEEDRRAGRITETAYQRARRQLLRDR